MRLNLYLPGVLIAVVSSIIAAEADAQTRRPYRDNTLTIDAAGVAARLRVHGDAGPALHVLRQENGPQPEPCLDEIADTLTQIALTLPGEDVAAISARRSAVLVLGFAGKRQDEAAGSGDGESDGVPYVGAAGRLITILETAPSQKTRHDALVALPDVLERSTLLAVLRNVAISDQRIAVTAIRLLGYRTGPEGIEVLRELYRECLVTAPGPQEFLGMMAVGHRWPGSEMFPRGDAPCPRRR